MLSNTVVAIICWHERHRHLLHGMHFPLVTFCLLFRSTVFVPVVCLNDVFLWKAMNVVALNTFSDVLLIFNTYQCLLIISLIFGKVGLYVTKNGITFFRTVWVLFNRLEFSRLATFWIWIGMMFSLYPFSINRSTKSFEYFLYSSKVEQTHFILNAWL